MFKKTLLATALSVAALNASAAVVVITGTNVSQEGAAGQASIAVPSAVVTLGSEYTVNDTVTFTISAAEFDTTNSVPALTYADASGGDGSGTMTLGLLNTTATTVTFRITDLAVVTGDAITTGDTLTLSGMVMTTATALDATGDISVAYSALTNNNQVLDSSGTLTDVAQTIVAQFSASTTKSANGIIDVNNDRYQFTAGDDTTTTDVITVTTASAAVATHAAIYDGSVEVLSGSFNWMDDDADGTVEAAELTTHFTPLGLTDDTFTKAINAAGDEITVTWTDGGGNDAEAHQYTFTAVPGDEVVLPTQTITVTNTTDYTTAAAAAATKAVQTAAAAGSWTLNGKVATINYMPFGDNTQVIMRATNTGVQTGDVTVRYMLEGVDTSWNTVSGSITSLAPGVTNIADLVMNAIKADAGVSKGKLAIEITANVPTGDATVYASYKVVSESDRGFVGNF